MVIVKKIFAAAFLMLLAFSATAQTLLFDTSTIPATYSTSDRTGGAISLKVETSVDSTLSRLEAFINPLTPTNVRFLIATNTPDAVVFYSDPVAVSAGEQWVISPVFNFTLTSGQRYEIAAMVEDSAYFPYNESAISQNNITAFPENGNPTNYAAPTNLGEVNGVTPFFRFYSGTAPPATPVPALPLWALWVLAGITGLIGAKRLRKAA